MVLNPHFLSKIILQNWNILSFIQFLHINLITIVKIVTFRQC